MRSHENRKGIESGSANLEFMQYAVNYNLYLVSLLRKNLSSTDVILDFGAGTGEFALSLAKHGFNVSVLEVEPTLCSKLTELGFNAYTTLAEIPDGSQSAIYSLNVLEHIKEDFETLKLISTKLTPNGKLILYLPAFKVLFSDMDERVGHYRRYNKRSLTKILIDAGLEIEKIRYSDFLGFFATLIYKLVPNRDGTISIPLLRLYDCFIFPMNIIFDRLFHKFLGKNIFTISHKVPEERSVQF